MSITVASETVAHPHGHVLRDSFQRLDFAVARLARDPPVHVGAVVEKDVVGEFVDALPGHWLSGLVDGRELHYCWAIGPGDAVAIHAGLY